MDSNTLFSMKMAGVSVEPLLKVKRANAYFDTKTLDRLFRLMRCLVPLYQKGTSGEDTCVPSSLRLSTVSVGYKRRLFVVYIYI